MPRSTRLPVVHPHRVDISRDASERCGKTRKKARINNSRTQAAKLKTQEEYTEANRSVKRSIRADKRNYRETLATEAEEATYQNLRCVPHHQEFSRKVCKAREASKEQNWRNNNR
ncbi:hypothetical protein DPMN_000349 [Dreissena polymorpha]|uniref:Uncharacterized protein n=1 Tax=Dreissena polymorpha TaxID=45954 RepID=A0A9D4MIU1_DREPO|nr:hypothetical protein DPMN_000349 [Dreissena polymorpha]